MKYKVIILALLLVSSTSTIGLFFYPRAKAEVIDKVGAWALVTPTMDGAMAPGEWDDASVLTFDLTTLGDLHQTSVYVKNDASNLYMAVILRNDDYSSRDEFLVAFDDDHNGSIEDGEDAWHRMVVPEPPWAWGDAYSHWMSGTLYYSPDVSDGGTDDLISAATHTNTSGIGDYTFEFSHPLNTTDTAHDFSLSPGSTAGFGVDFGDYEGNLSWIVDDYPNGFAYTGNFIELDIASPPKTIWVPDNFTSIEEAINNASNGDIIQVRAGTYYEHVVVNKTVSLVGENRDTTIIDGNGTGNVINVTANNVRISGFTIRRSGPYNGGIYAHYSRGSNISQNIITNNWYGIWLKSSNNNTLVGNIASANFHGILLDCSNHSILTNNNASSNNYDGIRLDLSNDNILSGNVASSNNRSGVHLIRISCNNTLASNTALNNPVGIMLSFYNKNNVLVGNNASLNDVYGIYIADSSHNILVNNTVFGNEIGIELEESNNNILAGNTVSNNLLGGLRLFYSSNYNLIFHNNFINNGAGSFRSVNTWDNGYEGNYWSDYDGTDSEQDGIGDTPYIIDDNNTDNYPLMGLFYDFPVPWGEETYHVQVISNSTVSNLYAAIWLSSPTESLSPGDTFIHFNVSCEEGTGFCRVMIPRALLNDSYVVLVDGNEVHVEELPISNGTHAFLYFTYLHDTHEVIIVPEFPSALILLLLLIIVLIAIIAQKEPSFQES